MNPKMISKFTPTVFAALAHYVYCLTDPRNGEIFYVGRGQGNRVFDHDAGLESRRIGEIKAAKLEVGRYILCHGIDNATEAFAVESAFVGLLKSGFWKERNLLNQMQGGQYDTFIPKSASEIEAQYARPTLKLTDFREPILIVNITKNLCSADTVAEAAQGDWKISAEKVKKHLGKHYVIAEFKRIGVDIFKPRAWTELPDGRLRFENEPSFQKGSKDYDDLYERYCNRQNAFYKKGSQNTFRYVGAW